MNRDHLFWSAVGALAVGTAALTAVELGPMPDRSEPVPAAPSTASAAPREARDDARPRASGSSRTARARTDRASARPSTSTTEAVRPERADVREALAELVRASRARQSRAAPGGAPAVDPATRMPLVEMSFEQYRVWAKLGTMLAERDYRAVQELQPDLQERFDSELVGAMLDATASDYQAYLATVVETSCEGLDAESVWRKVAFMSLWLGKIERRSEELAAQEQEALRSCGY